MHLLVDGHNLIGQIPGINLADPDDEAQLVMLLRGYATRKRGRQVVVVFDHGVYGHPLQLDGYGVTCHFARSPQDADTQIIRCMSGLKRPSDWMLVTSDRRLAQAAAELGVRVTSSQSFAAQLLKPAHRPVASPGEQHDVRLSEAELAEWLQLFGEAPDDEAEEAAATDVQPKQQLANHDRRGKSGQRRGRRRSR